MTYGLSSGRSMLLRSWSAAELSGTVFWPVLLSESRRTLRSKSIWSQRRPRISPTRQPVRMSSRIAATVSCDSEPSYSAWDRTAERRASYSR